MLRYKFNQGKWQVVNSEPNNVILSRKDLWYNVDIAPLWRLVNLPCVDELEINNEVNISVDQRELIQMSRLQMLGLRFKIAFYAFNAPVACMSIVGMPCCL